MMSLMNCALAAWKGSAKELMDGHRARRAMNDIPGNQGRNRSNNPESRYSG